MSNPTFVYKIAAGQPDFSTEVAIRAFEPERPYPQSPTLIVYRTRFMQLRAYYTRPTAIGVHPDLPQVYFADDIDFQDRPGGLVEWTRVYTTLPISWSNYESDAYRYPGYLGNLGSGRNPMIWTVTAKVTNDYYAVGTMPTFKNNLANYDDINSTSWIKVQVSTTANVGTIPTCAGGTAVAARVLSDGTLTNHGFRQEVSATGMYPGSIFLKANTCNVARVTMMPNANISFIGTYATVDLSTGQVIDKLNCNPVVASIGEGWFRVRLESPLGSMTNVALGVALCDGAGNVTHNVANDLFAWRGMIDKTTTTVPNATVPPTQAGDGSTNYPIATPDVIPVKFGTRFLYGALNAGSNSSYIGYTAEYLSDGGGLQIASTPSRTTYNGWITTDNANTNSYSIESQDSTLSLWYGQIWQRTRKFVKAI